MNNDVCKFPSDITSDTTYDYKKTFNKTDIKRVKEIEKLINKLQNEQDKLCDKIDKYNSITTQIKALKYELEEIYNKNN